MIAERLSCDGQASNVRPATPVGYAKFQEAGASECRNQAPAFTVEFVAVSMKMFGAPCLEPVGQLPVPRLEKGPGEESLVSHQLPWKTGFCLFAKAS